MNQVRTTLSAVRDAVDVPAPDRVALQARVRAARRRRTTGRTAVALVAAVAVTAAAAGVGRLLPEEDRAPVASGSPLEVDDPSRVVGFVVQGRLVVGGPAGFTVTGIPARNVLGVLGGRVLLSDGAGDLVAVPVDQDGVPGKAERLGTGLRDYLDPAGGRIITQQEDDTYRAWSPETRTWTDLDVDPADGGSAAAFDGDHRVDSGPDGYLLIGTGGPVRSLPTGGGIIDEDLVAGVLALETSHGARFFDASTGELLSRIRGAGYSGRLAPDGTSYARTAPDGVTLVDPRDGRLSPVATEVDGSATGIAWTGPDTFVVAARGDQTATGTGTGTLQECDAVERTCRLLYQDPSGTLKLTS